MLVRLRDTEAELNEARDEGGYGARVAAFWATVGTVSVGVKARRTWIRAPIM